MRYLIILLLFCSCGSLRHYKHVALDNFRNQEERELLAKAANEEFPTVVDTPLVTVVYDSTAWKEINDAYNALVEDYIHHVEGDTSRSLSDTVFLTKIKSLKPATITKTVIKEIPVRSTAAEFQFKRQVDDCRRENEGLIIQARTAMEARKNARKTTTWLYIICGLLAAGHLVPLIRKGV